MTIANRLAGGPPTSPPPTVTCPHYLSDGTRRCRHYGDGGTCGRKDGFMCTEWLRVNGRSVPDGPGDAALAGATRDATPPTPPTAAGDGQHADRTTRVVGTGAPVVRDLFGHPVKVAPATGGGGQTPTAPTAPRRESRGSTDVHLARKVTDEEVASFRALGVEACIAAAGGEVWLVPDYTGRTDRQELRIDHGLLLAAVCAAFPGSRILKLEAAARDSGEKSEEK